MDPERKRWVLVCFMGSFVTWFVVRLVPMKKLGVFMGSQLENRQLCVLASEEQIIKARRIARVMTAVSNNVPWECKCLAEALCVKFLLNRHKIPCVIHLGAKFDEENKIQLAAHAWVNIERYTIIGGPGHKQYQIVSSLTYPSFT